MGEERKEGRKGNKKVLESGHEKWMNRISKDYIMIARKIIRSAIYSPFLRYPFAHLDRYSLTISFPPLIIFKSNSIL